MKKILVAAMVLGLLGMAGAAWAADTAVVNVNATVVGTCQFLSDGTIAFGNLDPSVAGDVDGAVTQPTFWCTKNATYAITDDNGENESGTTYRMKHETLDEYIPYTFTYKDSGNGGGVSATIPMDIGSTVLGSDYSNASSGIYSDTITLTVNP